jgi:hypothetical protein
MPTYLDIHDLPGVKAGDVAGRSAVTNERRSGWNVR